MSESDGDQSNATCRGDIIHFGGSHSDRRDTSMQGRLSHFVDDSCLKNVVLEDDASATEETNALRTDSLGTVDTTHEERRVIVVCDKSYIFTIVGVLRTALLLCSLLSLSCLASAGTKDYDVLQLPRTDKLRFHVFVCVFTFLLTAVWIVVDNSSVLHLFRFNWNIIDTVLCIIVAVVFVISSSLLIHTKYVYQSSYVTIIERTLKLLVVAGVFGFLCAALLTTLAVIRCFQRRNSGMMQWLTKSSAGQDMMMSPITEL
ncbi:uncharacterized protein LOC135377808 isoform X2 [Ornithodoros turicata]|uniref:uncharacterized protein LOC135377808 isoform X2 n=1 Tax=Ornithodoros turicata TaxID=34597 RepID=UPI0031394079